MGGGKETPRQKMIGMMYLVLTALLAMNVSKQILKGYIAVNDSMEASKKNLKENNTRILEAFSQSLGGNPAAKPYYDESLIAKKNIDETFAYIDKLKAEIIRETEGYESDRADTSHLKWMEKMSDYDKPSHILIGSEAATPKDGEWSARELRGKLDDLSKKLGDQLEKMQKDPKTKLFPADYEAIKKKFQSIKPIDTGEEDNGVKLNWEAANFYHFPEAAVITNLNKMQSDLRNVEAEILNVYSAASGKLAIKFDHIVARVVAPSSYILAGTPYEADVFLAASSSKLGQGDMEIILGVDSAGAAAGGKGELVPLVNGEGKMSRGTSGQGIQEYKGVIKYKNPDGTFKYYPFNGEYMVAAPSVAISAEQMKVFYSGVVNPVAIGAAGVAPTELVVNATGAGVKMVSKGGGKFDFTFSGTGDCNITVSAKTKDGVKPQGPAVKFKVKPLPKPELKISQKFSPQELKKGELSLVSGLGAGANGFEFQANYIVQSWEVTGKSKGKLANATGSGPNLDATARQILSSADVGSKVYFDAKIKGPDGKTNNITVGVKVTR